MSSAAAPKTALRRVQIWGLLLASSVYLSGCATAGLYSNKQGPKDDPIEIAWNVDAEHSNSTKIERFPIGLDRLSAVFSAAVLMKSFADSKVLDKAMKQEKTFEPLDRYFLMQLSTMLSRRNMPVHVIDIPLKDGIPDYDTLKKNSADWVFHIKAFETTYIADGLMGRYFPECSVVVVPYQKSTRRIFDPIKVTVLFNQTDTYGFTYMEDLKAVPDLGLKGLKEAIRTAANSVMAAIRN